MQRNVADKLPIKTVLLKIRRYINVDQAITIYKSMVLPCFCYGDVFLRNISTRQNDKMQKLENKAPRLCLQRDNRANVPRLHKDCAVNYVLDLRSMQIYVTLCTKGNTTLTYY